MIDLSDGSENLRVDGSVQPADLDVRGPLSVHSRYGLHARGVA
jgi:hypothetical protein